jgi:hypothetical protein
MLRLPAGACRFGRTSAGGDVSRLLRIQLEIVDLRLLDDTDGHDIICAEVEQLTRNQLADAAARRALERACTDVDLDTIRSRTRDRHVNEVRQRLMADLHAVGWSLPKIGRMVDRDHTTVMSGIRAHQRRDGKACDTDGCGQPAMGGGRWCHPCWTRNVSEVAA